MFLREEISESFNIRCSWWENLGCVLHNADMELNFFLILLSISITSFQGCIKDLKDFPNILVSIRINAIGS